MRRPSEAYSESVPDLVPLASDSEMLDESRSDAFRPDHCDLPAGPQQAMGQSIRPHGPRGLDTSDASLSNRWFAQKLRGVSGGPRASGVLSATAARLTARRAEVLDSKQTKTSLGASSSRPYLSSSLNSATTPSASHSTRTPLRNSALTPGAASTRSADPRSPPLAAADRMKAIVAAREARTMNLTAPRSRTTVVEQHPPLTTPSMVAPSHQGSLNSSADNRAVPAAALTATSSAPAGVPPSDHHVDEGAPSRSQSRRGDRIPRSSWDRVEEVGHVSSDGSNASDHDSLSSLPSLDESGFVKAKPMAQVKRGSAVGSAAEVAHPRSAAKVGGVSVGARSSDPHGRTSPLVTENTTRMPVRDNASAIRRSLERADTRTRACMVFREIPPPPPSVPSTVDAGSRFRTDTLNSTATADGVDDGIPPPVSEAHENAIVEDSGASMCSEQSCVSGDAAAEALGSTPPSQRGWAWSGRAWQPSGESGRTGAVGVHIPPHSQPQAATASMTSAAVADSTRALDDSVAATMESDAPGVSLCASTVGVPYDVTSAADASGMATVDASECGVDGSALDEVVDGCCAADTTAVVTSTGAGQSLTEVFPTPPGGMGGSVPSQRRSRSGPCCSGLTRRTTDHAVVGAEGVVVECTDEASPQRALTFEEDDEPPFVATLSRCSAAVGEGSADGGGAGLSYLNDRHTSLSMSPPLDSARMHSVLSSPRDGVWGVSPPTVRGVHAGVPPLQLRLGGGSAPSAAYQVGSTYAKPSVTPAHSPQPSPPVTAPTPHPSFPPSGASITGASISSAARLRLVRPKKGGGALARCAEQIARARRQTSTPLGASRGRTSPAIGKTSTAVATPSVDVGVNASVPPRETAASDRVQRIMERLRTAAVAVESSTADEHAHLHACHGACVHSGVSEAEVDVDLGGGAEEDEPPARPTAQLDDRAPPALDERGGAAGSSAATRSRQPERNASAPGRGCSVVSSVCSTSSMACVAERLHSKRRAAALVAAVDEAAQCTSAALSSHRSVASAAAAKAAAAERQAAEMAQRLTQAEQAAAAAREELRTIKAVLATYNTASHGAFIKWTRGEPSPAPCPHHHDPIPTPAAGASSSFATRGTRTASCDVGESSENVFGGRPAEARARLAAAPRAASASLDAHRATRSTSAGAPSGRPFVWSPRVGKTAARFRTALESAAAAADPTRRKGAAAAASTTRMESAPYLRFAKSGSGGAAEGPAGAGPYTQWSANASPTTEPSKAPASVRSTAAAAARRRSGRLSTGPPMCDAPTPPTKEATKGFASGKPSSSGDADAAVVGVPTMLSSLNVSHSVREGAIADASAMSSATSDTKDCVPVVDAYRSAQPPPTAGRGACGSPASGANRTKTPPSRYAGVAARVDSGLRGGHPRTARIPLSCAGGSKASAAHAAMDRVARARQSAAAVAASATSAASATAAAVTAARYVRGADTYSARARLSAALRRGHGQGLDGGASVSPRHDSANPRAHATSPARSTHPPHRQADISNVSCDSAAASPLHDVSATSAVPARTSGRLSQQLLSGVSSLTVNAAYTRQPPSTATPSASPQRLLAAEAAQRLRAMVPLGAQASPPSPISHKMSSPKPPAVEVDVAAPRHVPGGVDLFAPVTAPASGGRGSGSPDGRIVSRSGADVSAATAATLAGLAAAVDRAAAVAAGVEGAPVPNHSPPRPSPHHCIHSHYDGGRGSGGVVRSSGSPPAFTPRSYTPTPSARRPATAVVTEQLIEAAARAAAALDYDPAVWTVTGRAVAPKTSSMASRSASQTAARSRSSKRRSQRSTPRSTSGAVARRRAVGSAARPLGRGSGNAPRLGLRGSGSGGRASDRSSKFDHLSPERTPRVPHELDAQEAARAGVDAEAAEPISTVVWTTLPPVPTDVDPDGYDDHSVGMEGEGVDGFEGQEGIAPTREGEEYFEGEEGELLAFGSGGGGGGEAHDEVDGMRDGGDLSIGGEVFDEGVDGDGGGSPPCAPSFGDSGASGSFQSPNAHEGVGEETVGGGVVREGAQLDTYTASHGHAELPSAAPASAIPSPTSPPLPSHSDAAMTTAPDPATTTGTPSVPPTSGAEGLPSGGVAPLTLSTSNLPQDTVRLANERSASPTPLRSRSVQSSSGVAGHLPTPADGATSIRPPTDGAVAPSPVVVTPSADLFTAAAPSHAPTDVDVSRVSWPSAVTDHLDTIACAFEPPHSTAGSATATDRLRLPPGAASLTNDHSLPTLGDTLACEGAVPSLGDALAQGRGGGGGTLRDDNLLAVGDPPVEPPVSALAAAAASASGATIGSAAAAGVGDEGEGDGTAAVGSDDPTCAAVDSVPAAASPAPPPCSSTASYAYGGSSPSPSPPTRRPRGSRAAALGSGQLASVSDAAAALAAVSVPHHRDGIYCDTSSSSPPPLIPVGPSEASISPPLGGCGGASGAGSGHRGGCPPLNPSKGRQTGCEARAAYAQVRPTGQRVRSSSFAESEGGSGEVQHPVEDPPSTSGSAVSLPPSRDSLEECGRESDRAALRVCTTGSDAETAASQRIPTPGIAPSKPLTPLNVARTSSGSSKPPLRRAASLSEGNPRARGTQRYVVNGSPSPSPWGLKEASLHSMTGGMF